MDCVRSSECSDFISEVQVRFESSCCLDVPEGSRISFELSVFLSAPVRVTRNPGEFSQCLCLLEWSSVLKCIHLPAMSEFTVACCKHLLSLLQRELMTDVFWVMRRPTHSCDNGLEHMLSPVSRSCCNKGLQRDQGMLPAGFCKRAHILSD